MRSRAGFGLLFGILALAGTIPAATGTAGTTPKPPISSQEMLTHLNRTIAWYEHVSGTQPTAGASETLLLQENVRQAARQVVQKAFTSARVQAALLASQKDTGHEGAGRSSTLEQAAGAANARIDRLQSRIAELNQQISKAPKRELQTLIAQRDTLNANLQFAKTAQGGLKEILKFASSPEKSNGLAGQINLLAATDSLPSALGSAPQPAVAPVGQAAAAFHPELAGIGPLIANAFDLWRVRSQVEALVGDTDSLKLETQKVSAPLRARLRALINQGDVLAASTGSETDPEKLAEARLQIGTLSDSFKTYSAPMLPLSEQGIALQVARGNLEEWRITVGEQMQRVLGYLAFRLGGLAMAVLALLLLSEIVRRAIFRYVRDTRRRRQFVLIRRILVGIITVFIVVFASVSGLGSFATIAGFVTAGLAVALQNIILSVVAYFFLIGRYGLKTGDRVTVSGVNGQVLEVGLVRMYLMELSGAGTDVHSTGRVAAFSNSVIFQPAALIKQAPGTEYAWRSVSVTLTGDTDLGEARKRVTGAVESVYRTYQESIRRQQAAFEKAANIQLADAAPVSRARFTESGVEVSVRYPVVIDNMWDVDQRVLDAVVAELGKAPELKLAGGGYPKVAAGS